MAIRYRAIRDTIYEEMRNECIPEAEAFADSLVHRGPDYNDRWNLAFLSKMTSLCMNRGIQCVTI